MNDRRLDRHQPVGNDWTRTCRTCGKCQPITEFYKNTHGHGYTHQCKACIRVQVKAYRAANLDKVQAYDRERGQLESRKAANRARSVSAESRAAYSRKYHDKEPEGRAARIALGNAVRDGRVVKPDGCERCGEARRIHGHHEDYSKPLEVVWLCAPCHGARHREINAERRQQKANNEHV